MTRRALFEVDPVLGCEVLVGDGQPKRIGTLTDLGPESPLRELAKAPVKRRNLEHIEQVQLIAWSAKPETLAHHPELEYLAAIPNGGKRTKVVAMKLKAEGVKRGYPDLVLDVARGGYHGWKGELKVRGGSVKPDQAKWHDHLRRQGYRVDVRIGWEAMRDALLEYLTR